MTRNRINNFILQPHTAIFAVLTVCISTIYGHSYYPSFSLAPHNVHQPWPAMNTYLPPSNVFNPSYDWRFNQGSFYQPQLPPFFAEHTPSNETTEKPVEQTTSSGDADKISAEIPSFKPDDNDTITTTALTLDDIFKQTIISPEFGFVPREPVFISNTPVFPAYEQVAVPPRQDNFFVNHLNRLNDAYGLPGFRPFFYNESLRKLYSSNSTDSSASSADEDSKPLIKFHPEKTNDGKKPDLIGIIDQMYKNNPNIIVFNTKDTPFSHVGTDDLLDVRTGGDSDEQKSEKSPFYQVYNDTQFLNKSFLSTIAPYYH